MYKVKAAIEAIIFASAEPVEVSKLVEALGIEENKVLAVLGELEKKYNTEDSGVNLIRLNDSWQLCSNEKYIDEIRKVLDINKNAPLSPAGMEVLALVAYNEPVTKAYIEQVRGVDSSGVLSNLIQKGLVEERGRLELPGRPLLYGTTDIFLRSFGISSLEELPEIPNIEKKPE
ncbi:MAG: SMC-Scp complex subunit ScpB [Clostridia bacterium]|nr:SMC-Scp complex subunit ScpB [Clostridia bacterium]